MGLLTREKAHAHPHDQAFQALSGLPQSVGNLSACANTTAYGRLLQPYSVGYLGYREPMLKNDSKVVLWENVTSLMKKRYGKENLTRLAAEAEFGPGTSSRIKKMETSVGTDVLDQLAKLFELETWQLLVPGLDASAIPGLTNSATSWPMPLVDRERFEALPLESRIYLQGYLKRAMEEQEALVATQLKQSNGSR